MSSKNPNNHKSIIQTYRQSYWSSLSYRFSRDNPLTIPRKFKHYLKHRILGRTSTLLFGTICRCWLSIGNRFRVANFQTFKKNVENHPPTTSVITISNHASCMDDPAILAAVQSLSSSIRFSKQRWCLAAHEICFSKPSHSAFFSSCRCVPVVRGMGVYQRAIDFIIDRMNRQGLWFHIFPEGRVFIPGVDSGHLLPFKWGIGRILAELDVVPLIVPFWHLGMEDALPVKAPYIPKFRKTISIYFPPQPLDLSEFVTEVKKRGKCPVAIRKAITDELEKRFDGLFAEARKFHDKSA